VTLDRGVRIVVILVGKVPYLPHISASHQLQVQNEHRAQQRGVKKITPELVNEALSAG
jgi:hypothetical protein